MSATDDEIETEYWAYQYQENKVRDEIEDESFDLESVLASFAKQGAEREALKHKAALSQPAPVDDWEEFELG